MKRATMWAVAISLVLPISYLLAQEPKLRTHSGEVVSVDTANNRIVIKQRTGKEMTLDVASDVRVTKARQRITLSDVKPGDRVTTRCDESGGKCLLKSVRVQVARAAGQTS